MNVTVFAAAGNNPAIVRPGDAPAALRRPFDRPQHEAGGDVPNADSSVFAAAEEAGGVLCKPCHRREVFAVRGETHRPDVALLSDQLADFFLSARVPNADGLFPAADGEILPVRGDGKPFKDAARQRSKRRMLLAGF